MTATELTHLTLPCTYNSAMVPGALVDLDRTDLLCLSPFTLELPTALSKITSGRRDITLAILREDPLMHARCIPIKLVHGRPIRLVQLVQEPDFAQAVLMASDTPKEMFLVELARWRAAFKPVEFANKNRCDCRTSNLRELS